ncbi:MAG: phosphatidylserine decarboxylase [Chloroflexota bacterium]
MHRRGAAAGRAAGTLSLGFLALLVQFFRCPSCTTPLDPALVVAPSSGRVVHIGIEQEPEILSDRRLRISIFLSLFDAHVTRAPVAGRVTYQRYLPGRYLVALHPKASTLNERNSILIESRGGTPILVRQIAGFVARRIRSYVHVATVIEAGQELGFIRMGSRVDVFLPPDSRVQVRPGQAVRAGETVIAHLTDEQ